MQLEEFKSRNVNTSLRYENGRLTYIASIAPDVVMVPQRTVERMREVPVRVEVPVIEYRLNFFQKIFFWLGIVGALYGVVRFSIFFTKNSRTIFKH